MYSFFLCCLIKNHRDINKSITEERVKCVFLMLAAATPNQNYKECFSGLLC